MKITRNFLYTMAILVLAAWVLGCFFLHAGSYIHVFLMMAAILAMRAIMVNPKPQAQV